MSKNEPMADESTDAKLPARDRRALTQYLTVLEDVGRARGGDELYLVVSQSGKEYLVNARAGTCECKDAEYRDPVGGCKHVRRVAFATGARPIPESIPVDEIDDQFGAHVADGPCLALPDGGDVLTDYVDDAEDEDEDDGCWCEGKDLPCFEHFEGAADDE